MSFDKMSNEEIVQELAAVLAEMNDLKSVADDMKEELRRRAGGHLGTKRFGPLTLKVTANRRFDPERARSVLPVDTYKSILVPTPSSKRAKEVLSPEVYRMTMKEYDPKISIVFSEDDDGNE